MSELTKKQKKAYLKEFQPKVGHFGRKCPFCGSHDHVLTLNREVSGKLAELGTWIRFDVECQKCLECWQDIYKLVDVEGYEDED
jgi:hypothetical protein